MVSPSSTIHKVQHAVLLDLLAKNSGTTIGKTYDFKSVDTYAQFAQRVSPQGYQEIHSTIQKLKNGEQNLLWPGPVNTFAVSAGTSGEGKHLPLTEDRLQSDKRFMQQVVKAYLKQRPNVLNLVGAHLSMPGSVEEYGDLKIGEISGFTARNVPSWLSIFQIIDPAALSKLTFKQKFDQILQKALEKDVKVITAVPSWILTLFQQALQKTGKESIAKIWPNLKLLVCGGVKLSNYRTHLEQLANGLSLDFIETYGASEGYIGFSDDLGKPDLKMVIDNGIFFECIPHPLPNTDASAIQKTLPLWEIETGVPYGLLLTTNAGLWRYTLNDIIEFTSLNPLRFKVKGRVNDMLDEYGEALYIYEAEQALKKAAHELGTGVGTFTIAGALEHKNAVPKHFWFVHIPDLVHRDTLNRLGKKIDAHLQEMNRHYAIRRESDALGPPEVFSISQQQINNWLEMNGKQQAQGKLPSILKNEEDIDFFK